MWILLAKPVLISVVSKSCGWFAYILLYGAGTLDSVLSERYLFVSKIYTVDYNFYYLSRIEWMRL